MNDKYQVARTAISSLYYRFPESIFTRYGNTFKINYIFDNEQDDDKLVSIRNETRLKHKLINLISRSYGERIQAHDMNRTPLSTSTDLEIRKYILDRTNDNRNGGFYTLFPIEFICKKCKRILSLSEKELSGFSGICECSGEFEQNTIILFCEGCGIIKPLTDAHYCKKHANRNVKVNYSNRTSLRTWSIECVDCLKEGIDSKRDVFSLFCSHKSYGRLESNADPVKMRPLTVRDGGIVSPANIKTVDFETHIDSVDSQNYVMLAIEEGFLKMSDLVKLLPETDEDVRNIMDAVDLVYNLDSIKYVKNSVSEAIKYINKSIEEVKKEYVDLDVDAICDLLYLKRDSESKTYSEYLNESHSEDSLFYRKYNILREKYHIAEITHLNNIQLISSTYGLVYGPVKHYDKDYVPHFEPFWTNLNRKSIYALSYPFKTEGIMVELDPSSILKWLKNNKICNIDETAQKNPSLFLNRMSISSEEYRQVSRLVHTISHILIKKSVLFTGLDEDSYGELLFPSNHAFIIYSTSTVNIGGMDYLFKYHLPSWFSELDTDSCDCVFDPSCINDEGACFNCLYLPEYVCSNFNNELSRTSLIGNDDKDTYGFWRLGSD